ncbi:ABC transporter permease [Streptomyces sp. NPDC056656]|uniref:ABC transporter permease n=1 Tax=Streptomyces sp. NPDC056656 TaxID=3345895 RepID=UPI00369B11A4
MTALSVPAGATSRRIPRPSGLAWTVLRLHRTALIVWSVLVVGSAGALLWACGPGADAARKELARCGGLHHCDPTGPAYGTYETVSELGSAVIFAAPFLAAVWAGALAVGRELESGTAALAWTQSVSPARWLAAKLALPALALTAGTTLLVLLHRLMWSTGGGELLGLRWYEDDAFQANGPIGVAYALCGLTFGALAGVATRRTLHAPIGAVAALFFILGAGVRYGPSLWPADTVTGAKALQVTDTVQILEHGAVTADGRRIGNNWACVDSDSAADVHHCMKRTGLTEFWATYHPSGHFWPLQLMESGAVLAVAALAVVAAFLLLRRRTA